MGEALTRILVVNDDVALQSSLADNLRLESYEVRLASGEGGLATAIAWPADLVVLDLVRRTANGSDLLFALRERGCHVPVLVLSQGNLASQDIERLRLDGVQHVTGPLSVLELIEPVRALLDRGGSRNGNGTIRFGSIVVDTGAHTVMRRGQQCSLTPKAFALLVALARRHGEVVSRTELLREVWGYGPHVLTRTVDSHVAELRRKLEDDPSRPRHIVTVWAVGYRFVA
jgi:two-component system alkaline phosphatase synthesis response regulator PhoP